MRIQRPRYRTLFRYVLWIFACFGATYAGLWLGESRVPDADPAPSRDREGHQTHRMAHDFGVVLPGKKLNHTFHVVNPTSFSARVLSVRSSCACTTAVVQGDTIGPKGSLPVPVELTGKGAAGPFNSTVFVELSTNVQWELQLSGYTECSRLETVDLGSLRQDAEQSKIVPVSWRATSPEIRVVRVDWPSQLLNVTWEKNSNSENSFLLTCRVLPTAPFGEFDAVVRVISSDSVVPVKEVPLKARILRKVEADECSLSLGQISLGQTRILCTRVYSPYAIPITVSDVEFPIDLEGSFVATPRSPSEVEVCLTIGVKPDDEAGAINTSVEVLVQAEERIQRIRLGIFGLSITQR